MEMQKQSHQSLQPVQKFISQSQIGRSQQLNLAAFAANGKGTEQNHRGMGHVISHLTLSCHQSTSAGKILNLKKRIHTQEGETYSQKKQTSQLELPKASKLTGCHAFPER